METRFRRRVPGKRVVLPPMKLNRRRFELTPEARKTKAIAIEIPKLWNLRIKNMRKGAPRPNPLLRHLAALDMNQTFCLPRSRSGIRQLQTIDNPLRQGLERPVTRGAKFQYGLNSS